jgi:hypothetical protein
MTSVPDHRDELVVLCDELARLSSTVDSLERRAADRRRASRRRTGTLLALVAAVTAAAGWAVLRARPDGSSPLELGAIAGVFLLVLAAVPAARVMRAAREPLARFREEAAATTPPLVSARENAITAALSIFIMIGLYLDGWRHINLADGRAGAFLTIWHVPLYFGITLTGTWLTTRNQDMRALLRGRFDVLKIPQGYRLGVLGMAIITVGAMGDAVWHTFYGIEQGIERTLSPFHIMLFTGGTLIASSPARAAWAARRDVAPSFRRFMPALLSLTFSAAFVLFIVQFLSAFLVWTKSVPSIAALGDAGENTRIVGTSMVLVTNFILIAPLVYALRRWQPPFGTATFLFATVATLDAVLTELSRGWTIAAAAIGGLVADLLIRKLGASPRRPAAQLVVTAVAPLALWLAYFLTLGLAYGVWWERNVWLSSILLASLGGLALCALTAPAVQTAAIAAPEHERELRAA